MQFLTFDGQKSSGLIKGVQFGTVQPGVSVVETMVLMSSGAPGDRTIDVSIQSSNLASQSQSRASSPSESADDAQNHNTDEILRTLSIPTLSAFVVHQDVDYRRSLQSPPALADLAALEGPWEASVCGEAVVTTVVECTAACGVEVEEMTLRRVVCLWALYECGDSQLV